MISNLPHRTLCLAAAALSAAALAVVFTAQYAFGLEPCALCLYQRVPYAIVIVLGLCVLVIGRPRAILAVIGLCFLAGAALAGFHAGVEKHWWEGLSSCSAQLDDGDLDKLREQILNGPRARCDAVAWSAFGISMAGYNFLVSLILAAVCFIGARRKTPASGG